ncbi:MAG: redoxin domain-containing protein [Deltaproteobacteria bacterium]
MKNIISYVLCAILVLIGFPIWTCAAEEIPKAGEEFPNLILPVPEAASQKAYLGITEGNTFKLSQIKADILILEIFSMYCPHCQREAKDVNRVFELIEGDPKLKGKIKLIGLGAGNSAFEVDVFRKKYSVPFPLFPDQDFSHYKRFGKVRTPYFFFMRLKTDGTCRVFYTKLGSLDGAERFLKEVVSKSKR